MKPAEILGGYIWHDNARPGDSIDPMVFHQNTEAAGSLRDYHALAIFCYVGLNHFNGSHTSLLSLCRMNITVFDKVSCLGSSISHPFLLPRYLPTVLSEKLCPHEPSSSQRRERPMPVTLLNCRPTSYVKLIYKVRP
jgi:hypothetical protein